jgi:hypothetical protein
MQAPYAVNFHLLSAPFTLKFTPTHQFQNSFSSDTSGHIIKTPVKSEYQFRPVGSDESTQLPLDEFSQNLTVNDS